MDGPILDFHMRLVPSPASAERLVDVLDSCRIDRAVVAAGGVVDRVRLSRHLVEGGYVDADADNEFVRSASARSGGRLVPFYFANPHRPAARYRAAAADFRGVEISPAVHGLPLTSDPVARLVEVAGEVGHSVYVVCLERAGCRVTDLVRLARRFGHVAFVLGHAGIGNIDYYGVDVIADQANVLLETSGGYSSVLAAALDRLGPSRMLFGSEWPQQHPAVELMKYGAVGLPDSTWRQVAWENADRLLEGRKT